jgi:ankyrin repeat protein
MNNEINKKLFKACRAGNLEVVKQCIKEGADVNQKNATQLKTPLMVAVDFGWVEIVKILIIEGANFMDLDTRALLSLHETFEKRVEKLKSELKNLRDK